MPPKPTTKGVVSKPATKTATNTGLSKAGTTGSTGPKTGTKTGAKTVAIDKGATKESDVKKLEKEMEQVSIKKVLVPETISLKESGELLTLSGDGIGKKIRESNRWQFLIDHNGNVNTFFKYRDVNMISAASGYEFQREPVRKALMGALRFGKPHIIDIGDKDMDIIRDMYNEIYKGLWDDIMDKSILEPEKYGKLYQPNDEDEYKNRNEYNRLSDFQFIVYTTTDPPSTAIDSFIPIIIE